MPGVPCLERPSSAGRIARITVVVCVPFQSRWPDPAIGTTCIGLSETCALLVKPGTRRSKQVDGNVSW